MDLIFHEKQDGALCAQHCLNSLLQGDYYSAVDLAHIAEELDKVERSHMAAAGITKEYEKFLSEKSSNYDDSGFFSIQVLQRAVESWGLELIPYSGQNEIAISAKSNPVGQKAFICNFRQHWYTIRKIGKYWFNLNSLFKKPQLISNTYLAVLLAQLENDGYSIFVVAGELPKGPADAILTELQLNVNDIVRQSAINQREENLEENEDFDDDELKKAIKMSLIENDLDLDSHKLYPSLINEQVDEEAELKKAIELSLLGEVPEKEKSDASTSQMSADEIRNRRLKHFSNAQNENLNDEKK